MAYPFFLFGVCFSLGSILTDSVAWLGVAVLACVAGLGRVALWRRKLSMNEWRVSRSSIVMIKGSAPSVELEVRDGDVLTVFPMSRWAPWHRFPSGTQLLVLPKGSSLVEPVDTRRMIEIYRPGSAVCRILADAGMDAQELRPRGTGPSS